MSELERILGSFIAWVYVSCWKSYTGGQQILISALSFLFTDEAQMGGLSTLLSTASTSSSSNQNIASGPSSLTTFTTAYVSAANTSTARCAPIDSFPSVAALSTLSDANSATSGSSNATANSTCGSSLSTNTSVTTSLSTWSGPVQPSATAPIVSPDSNNPAISNGPKPGTGSDPGIVTTSQSSVQSSLSETATNMTPPKPPKKRYVHANMLDQPVPVVSTQAQIVPSPEKTKVSHFGCFFVFYYFSSLIKYIWRNMWKFFMIKR